MTILGRIIDTIMVLFYVAFCLLLGLATFKLAVESDYGAAIATSALMVFMAVKVNPWRSSVVLPCWLIKTFHVCGRASDRAADAIEHKTRAMGRALWIGLKVIFFVGIIPALVIATFLAWPVVCLLLLILFVLWSIFKFLVLQAEKEGSL